MQILAKTWPAALAVIWLTGCAHQIAEYSLEAYKNATSLKAETGALIDKSGEPYARHVEDVDELTVKINSAYEFSAGTPRNAISAAQWNILRDPDGNLYGGFVSTWKDEGTTSAAYRKAKKRQVNRAFDYIICLEANKQTFKPCGPPASAQ